MPRTPTEQDFIETAHTEDFTHLRSTFRGFVFPVFVAFITWYLLYIVTATFLVDVVTIKVFGYINLGMVLGIAQFLTAGIVTWAYLRFADNTLDPASALIREQMNERLTEPQQH
ncbi:DUF485 domain-containing protein [Corynebacterium sp. 11A]|uniref:DUF485 domain-containing protein n=1 Tax=Corynebacterium sp. 11A TaxID=2080510 RepID=UPI001CEF5BA5|nr:DUF485 domain-containing protein [Corynebacterium sp. 11A]